MKIDIILSSLSPKVLGARKILEMSLEFTQLFNLLLFFLYEKNCSRNLEIGDKSLLVMHYVQTQKSFVKFKNDFDLNDKEHLESHQNLKTDKLMEILKTDAAQRT